MSLLVSGRPESLDGDGFRVEARCGNKRQERDAGSGSRDQRVTKDERNMLAAPRICYNLLPSPPPLSLSRTFHSLYGGNQILRQIFL